jgi:hypothetical protein
VIETVGFWLMFGVLIVWPAATYLADAVRYLVHRLREDR